MYDQDGDGLINEAQLKRARQRTHAKARQDRALAKRILNAIAKEQQQTARQRREADKKRKEADDKAHRQQRARERQRLQQARAQTKKRR